MFFGPHLLEADDGRCRQTWRVADEGRQHFLEVAGRDSLQVEDGDQHLKALRSPRVSRQDRWRVSDALAFARGTVAHPRLANGDRADAGHDVALWKMAMTHHALMARLGLEIRMLCEKLSNLRLDRLSQQRTRAAAQDLCQGVGEDPWLGELDDVIVGHGVSLLHWRSGGVGHHHDTPPYPVSPSPTSGHTSEAIDEPLLADNRSASLTHNGEHAGHYSIERRLAATHGGYVSYRLERQKLSRRKAHPRELPNPHKVNR